MGRTCFCFALLLAAFFLLGCAGRAAQPAEQSAYICADGTKVADASFCKLPPAAPQQQCAAPSINTEPLQSHYAPGEIARRCSEAIAKANASLNKIAAQAQGQRATALLDYEAAMADFWDEAGTFHIVAVLYPDANISAEGFACDEKVGSFWGEASTRKDVYLAVREFTSKNAAEARLYNRTVTGFELNGLNLPDEKLALVREMKQNLSLLESRFAQNLNMDNKTVEFTAAELEGAQPDFLSRLARAPDGKYIVTMKYPDYYGVMENVKSPEARKRMSLAFQNRGSPAENTRLLEEAIAIRQRLSGELGFATWADYRTGMRMAKNASNVDAFLSGLREALSEKSRQDIAALLSFKKTLEPNATQVDSWDVLYLENQLKKAKYSLDGEKVREYFPLDSTMEGMFSIFASLYNVSFEKVGGAKVWAPEVLLYRIADADCGRTRGYIYFDMFPREGKYGHEAMSQVISGRERNGTYVQPVAVIMANKNPPAAGKPALLAHDEIVGMFHELGHSLHAVLTRAPYASLSGTNVAWDFVETPSQFQESWAWEPQVIDGLSSHYSTSQRMPAEMRDTLIAVRDLDQGYFYATLLARSQMDMDFHTAKGPVNVTAISDFELENITGMAPVPGNSYPATFGHLMGGYDAGYYSYMWSQTYAFDCFSEFQLEGIGNQSTGIRYRRAILEQGDMKDGDALLREFLGRDANSDAFMMRLNVTNPPMASG